MAFFRCASIVTISWLVSCGQVVTSTPNDPPHATDAVCAFGSQCESGACSSDELAGTCGHCLESQPLGAPCGMPHQACGPHATCDFGVCKDSEIPIGQPCELGPLGEDVGRCVDEAFCLDGNAMNDGSLGTCVHRAKLGEACTANPPGTPCLSNAACENGACVPNVPRKLGESCDQAPCEADLFCDGPICHLRMLKEGDPCGIQNGQLLPGDCVKGLLCGNLDHSGTGDTCVLPPKEGAACFHDQCAEGLLCDQPVLEDGSSGTPFCTQPHGEGQACGINPNGPASLCQSSLECRAHVCRVACR